MRIGLVCEDFREGGYGGGISGYTDTIAQGLIALGHEVHVFRIGRQGLSTYTTAEGIHCHEVPYYTPRAPGWRTLYWRALNPLWHGYLFNMRWSIALGRYIRRLAATGKLDVLEVPETGARVCWHGRSIRCHIPICVRLHAPSIITASTTFAFRSRDLRQIAWMERRLIDGASVVTAPSSAVAEVVRRELQTSCEQWKVIPNPVALPAIRHVGVEAWRNPKVLFVGRLEELKGIESLIRAFALVASKNPRVILELIGPDGNGWCTDGIHSLLRRFLSDADSTRLLPRVIWHGPRPREEVHKARSDAVCVAVPSKFENFPYALAEAMAIGCPVVANRIGGMPEMIQHGVNGWLVDCRQPEELADAILYLIDNPEPALASGIAARTWIARYCDPINVSEQMVECYQHALACGGKVRSEALA